MNSTWNSWSVDCCKYRTHNEYIFIGSTSAVLIITILLYIVVQFCGDKKAPTIIQRKFFSQLQLKNINIHFVLESRFAESINRL